MRLSASRSCLVAGAKPRRVLPRARAITSRFESLEKLWRRRDERTSFGPSRRDSNPCFSLERASPWLVISPTSTPGATARCHSACSFAAGPRASAIGRSTRARDEGARNFQTVPTVAHREPLGAAHKEQGWRRDRTPDVKVVSWPHGHWAPRKRRRWS